MSWLQQTETNQGRGVLACAAVFAVCFGAFTLLNSRTEATSFYSIPAVNSVSTLAPQATAVPRYLATGRTLARKDFSEPAVQVGAEDFVLVSEDASSSMRTMGLTAFCMSLVLATAGLALRMLTHSQTKQTVPLSFVELTTVDDSFAMAAATAKKSKKAKKAPKAKKEEKEKREPIVLTPQQVFYRMRKGVLRRAIKPTKTTGRVCQILGKVDNRKARTISFSHRRTKRLQKVNLHWRRLYWEEGKCFVLLRLSTKGIKTVTKYGLHKAAIKFGLDLTKHINGTSERKYIKYLPEKEKKLALVRGAQLRYRSAVRWARLTDSELPAPPAAVQEPATIAMAISHGVKIARLGRPADQRKALVRSLTTELLRHGRIKTTMVRAKAIRKHVDHMITLAKTNTLHTRRQALGFVYDKNIVKTLFEQVPERYADRQGGYTRIIRTMPRKGDSAKMCFIELV